MPYWVTNCDSDGSCHFQEVDRRKKTFTCINCKKDHSCKLSSFPLKHPTNVIVEDSEEHLRDFKRLKKTHELRLRREGGYFELSTSLRGRKSDWSGEEIQAKAIEDLVMIENIK